MSEISLFSQAFCDTELKDPYSIRPCRRLWEKWIQDNLDRGRLFLRIHHPFFEDEESFLCSVGDPIQSDLPNSVFLPMWMIDSNKYQGCGEIARFQIVLAEELPRAERIVLRPVENVLTEIDVVSALEKSFSQFGVLQQGRLYQVPLEELGGLEAHIYIEVLEPAEEVYLDGDEIPLEFEQSIESIRPPAPVERVPTPPPTPPTRLNEPDLMVPVNFLAGAIAPPGPSRFVPFSGVGHVLGSGGTRSNASSKK